MRFSSKTLDPWQRGSNASKSQNEYFFLFPHAKLQQKPPVNMTFSLSPPPKGSPSKNSVKGIRALPVQRLHPPPRTQTGTLGHFISEKVPQTIRARVQTPQNEGNIPKKVAPNHPGKGLDPPPPYGQCPNAFYAIFGGASLSLSVSRCSCRE